MERDMASIIFSAKDIFEQEFGREVRGYSRSEVDEFLDDVIKDYETYAALLYPRTSRPNSCSKISFAENIILAMSLSILGY